NRWYNLSVYYDLTEQKGYNLCSYSLFFDKNKVLFCGNKAITTKGGVNKYRCELCQSKQGANIKIPPRWVSLDYYFSSSINLCSYIPKEGDNFGDFCGLPAVKTQCDKKDYRCKLCIGKDSNVILFDSYSQINKEVHNKKRVREERWLPTDKYIRICTVNPKNYLCSYSPPYGNRYNLHCAKSAVAGDKGSFWEYRCSDCKSKTDKSTISVFMKYLLKEG
ncbi:MAG TPA: hypothetical protein PK891_06675, partial [Bacteroidales bacterium]|nr:hypothetical protein [Bacteroidales bacterium]